MLLSGTSEPEQAGGGGAAAGDDAAVPTGRRKQTDVDQGWAPECCSGAGS